MSSSATVSTAGGPAAPDDGQARLDRLVELLDLEPIEKDIFRGGHPNDGFDHVFGGQVAAQALMAAGRTVEADRAVHSLHAYFIRRGDPKIPIVYTVDRIRDGRSFTTRRVVGVQHGEGIFALEASFQLAQDGVDHHEPMPTAPDPEEIPPPVATDSERLTRLPRAWPFELRELPVVTEPGHRGHRSVWTKATGRLPDDPLLHACAFAFVSDLTPTGAIVELNHINGPFGSAGGLKAAASLDHAIWFHRPFRADEWLLHDSESPSASGSRGLAISRIFKADGQHVATTAQEIMMRV
jgi:acyl-CoA thioesterase-2